MRRLLRFSVIGLLVLVVIGNAGLLAALVVTREPAPKPLTGERITAGSRPAIVLVQANYVITTSIPSFTIPQSKEDLLVNQVIARVRAGTVAPNQAAAERAAVNLVVAHPDTYYVPGARVHDDYDIVSTGSGFFVTEDGYLVTAAHVVSADKAEIRAEAISLAQDPDNIAQERRELADSFARDTGLSLTSAQVNSMVKFVNRWYTKYLLVDKVDVKYYLGSGSVETGDRLVGAGARATVVSIDPTATGHDIAIMKADLNHVPTLDLAKGSPHLGDTTYAIGYPRQGYLDEEAPLDQTIGATMTSGKIGTTTSRTGGWTAWGTNAQFTHGDSGGPVVGADGKVLGVISFIEADENGNQLPGQGYFVPAEFVVADLAAASVHPTNDPKGLTGTYYAALAHGDNQWFRPELALLQQIKDRAGWQAYVGDDISHTQSQILSGNDKTPPDLRGYVLASPISAGSVIALAVVIWIAMGVAGRRRKPSPLAAGPA